MITATIIKSELLKHQRPEKAKFHLRFFKTGKGEYGEGDQFLGVSMPNQRKVAKKYHKEISLKEITDLLKSKIHEHRMTGLLFLVYKYEKSNEKEREILFNFYIKNLNAINNWDLVDVTTPNIVGNWLIDKDKDILYTFARSSNLWKRRIAILATFRFIKHNKFDDTLKIAKILLNDKHDLIHKAVGWMLREIGKRDQVLLETFLHKHYKEMPRTMLRYAIERFEESKRKMYLKGQV
jgi:3-methyladenine DNA glycosylase AlkD